MEEKKYFFLGLLTPPCKQNLVSENSIVNVSNAPNVFQWSLIKGMFNIIGDNLHVINVLPVGTFPKQYKKLNLTDSEWCCENVPGYEIGCVNIPFMKQLIRYFKTKQYLKRCVDRESEIIIYSTYLPFLKSVIKLDKIKCTLIVTDIPEYYDLANVGVLKKRLRKLQNKAIYNAMRRVDRFVLLTKEMTSPLDVGERPWMIMEGLYDSDKLKKTVIENIEINKHRIFYSGTLNYKFGIKELVDAFSQIINPNFELWICGAGEAETYIKHQAEKDKRIKYFGFCSQSEVEELRLQATILVNPRTNKGEYTKYSFPSKTMEYMASGKPVIMYKLDGVPEDYYDYLNFISEGDPVDCIKKQLLYVINNYSSMKDKAKGGKEFIASKKNSIAQAKRLIEFLSEEEQEYQRV